MTYQVSDDDVQTALAAFEGGLDVKGWSFRMSVEHMLAAVLAAHDKALILGLADKYQGVHRNDDGRCWVCNDWYGACPNLEGADWLRRRAEQIGADDE